MQDTRSAERTSPLPSTNVDAQQPPDPLTPPRLDQATYVVVIGTDSGVLSVPPPSSSAPPILIRRPILDLIRHRFELRSFLAAQAPAWPQIGTVVADYRESVIDLLFVVDGDLYQGETAALNVLRSVQDAMPTTEFDVMIMPRDAYSEGLTWGETDDPVYKRHPNVDRE